VSKSKASDYFTAGIILSILAGIIWLLENFVLNKTVDNTVLFIIPAVFVLLSVAHFVIGGTKWRSSR
jgi:hypothetical protein